MMSGAERRPLWGDHSQADRERRDPVTKTSAVLTSILLGFVLGAPCSARVQLDLFSVVLPKDAEVTFTRTFSEPVAEVLDETRDCLWAATERYKVCADLDQTRLGRSGETFSYTLYVVPKDTVGGHQTVRFVFQAEPKGAFRDQKRDVDFAVSEGDYYETAQLHLPLHSQASEPFLEAHLPQPGEPVRVRIGKGTQEIPIGVENELEDLHVLVSDNLRVNCERSDLWRSPPVAELVLSQGVSGGQLSLPPTELGAGKIQLKVEPIPFKALLTSARPYRTTGEEGAMAQTSGVHDRITVYIPYQARGGVRRELAVGVPIRFWPTVWVLIPVTLAGTLIGSLLLIFQGPNWRTWLLKTVAALVMAPFAWLLAMFLLEDPDSVVKIKGLELDPAQVSSAFVIGGLLGLVGSKGLPLLQKVPMFQRFLGENRASEGGAENARRDQ